MGSLVFDKEAALARVDGDLEFFDELSTLLAQDFPMNYRLLFDAVAGGRAEEACRIAHCIKSALGNLGAMQAYDLAMSLEMAGRSGKLDGAGALVKQLEAAFAEYQAEVKLLRS